MSGGDVLEGVFAVVLSDAFGDDTGMAFWKSLGIVSGMLLAASMGSSFVDFLEGVALQNVIVVVSAGKSCVGVSFGGACRDVFASRQYGLLWRLL